MKVATVAVAAFYNPDRPPNDGMTFVGYFKISPP
jgi:hypothetical protein